MSCVYCAFSKIGFEKRIWSVDMNLVKWFRINNKKVMEVVVDILMVLFGGR